MIQQGLGPIGLCAAKWAKLKGASRVIGIDKNPERLAFAQEAVGIETINFTEFSDVPKRIHELVPGGIDIALDCGKYLLHYIFHMALFMTHIDFLLLRHVPRTKDPFAQSPEDAHA